MFRLSLKDVGAKRVSKSMDVNACNLIDAVVVARTACADIVGYDDFEIRNVHDDMYAVLSHNLPVGGFELTEVW